MEMKKHRNAKDTFLGDRYWKETENWSIVTCMTVQKDAVICYFYQDAGHEEAGRASILATHVVAYLLHPCCYLLYSLILLEARHYCLLHTLKKLDMALSMPPGF
jgi:hypothetical protein